MRTKCRPSTAYAFIEMTRKVTPPFSFDEKQNDLSQNDTKTVTKMFWGKITVSWEQALNRK